MQTKSFYFAALSAAYTSLLSAQVTISTYAGGPPPTGSALAVSLADVADIKSDPAGNVYIAVPYIHVVYRMDTTGNMTVIAGTGTPGFNGDGGPGTSAQLVSPFGLALDKLGNLYISDPGSSRIRKLTLATGIISTFAGNGHECPGCGDGGPADLGTLFKPLYLAVDSANSLYVSDYYRVRKIANGIITTVAGTGVQGYSGDGALATQAQLSAFGLAIDSSDALYIADVYAGVIRRVQAGIISTVAGTGGTVYTGNDTGPARSVFLVFPRLLAIDSSNNLIIADARYIRKMSGGIISIVAGGGFSTEDGINALGARLDFPRGLAFDRKGNILVSIAALQNVIRTVINGTIVTVAGSGQSYYNGEALSASVAIIDPAGNSMAQDAKGNLYFPEPLNSRVRKLSPSGVVTTVAGTGTPGFSGDGGLAVQAQLSHPQGIAIDRSGRIYIADQGNNRVRLLDTDGIIRTVAGTGDFTFNGDGLPPLQTNLYGPSATAVDNAGVIYIAESYGGRIRKVANGTVTTIAGTGAVSLPPQMCYAGPATSIPVQPAAIALDPNGNVVFSSAQVDCVGTIKANQINLVAGTANTVFSFFEPHGYGGDSAGIALDVNGNVYIADTNNPKIFEVSNNSLIQVAGDGTITGTGLIYSAWESFNPSGTFGGDGGSPLTASLSQPTAVVVDAVGNLFIADSGNFKIRAVSVNGPMVSTTFNTNPAGLSLIIDGEPYATPRSFTWFPGSKHRISAVSPQASVNVFGSWSDGGTQTHFITASSANYTANFASQPAAPCTFTLSSQNAVFTNTANSGSLTFTASASTCSWTAVSHATWIDITSASFGNGSGSMSFEAQQNWGPARSGSITVADHTVTVFQSASDFFTWQSIAQGVVGVWYMGGADGSVFENAINLSGPVLGWKVVAVADLDGNGAPDLIWQQDGTNVVGVWYMGGPDGTVLLDSRNLSGPVPGWRIAAAADLDRNGHPDLIWQQDSTNIVGVWYMGGNDGSTLWSARNLSGPVPGWRIVGAGDLDGNGHPDLIWQQDATNVVGVWYMGGSDGSVLQNARNLSGPVPGWRIVGLEDLDRNGHPDLIWQQDTTNVVGVWYMGGSDGSVLQNARNLSGPVPGWKIVGPK